MEYYLTKNKCFDLVDQKKTNKKTPLHLLMVFFLCIFPQLL